MPETNEEDDRNSLFEEADSKRDAQPRGSFVGTPLYVAPEMLNENRSGPPTDLWALGCIIYQLRVGYVPFNGQFDYEVFQKITDRQLQFPNDLEPEAIDIIDALLHLDPSERLGAGPPGSHNDYEALKAHPFFKGINFKTLSQTAPPIPAERYNDFFKKQQKTYQKRDLGEIIAKGDLEEETSSGSSRVQSEQPSDAPKVVMQGVVKRIKNRFGLRTPCLNLILESKPYPRLYITSTMESDSKEGIYKKDILLYGALKAHAKTNDIFEISCPYSKKKYTFDNFEAKKWAEAIMLVIIDIRSHEENFDQYLS